MFFQEDEKYLREAYKCKKIIGNYLCKKGLPVLSKSMDGELFYFRKTEKLFQELDKLPFWLKIFT